MISNSTAPSINPAISVIYWRQSLWNASQCVPVVLRLDADGQLSMTTADKQVAFAVSVAEVTPRFTGWGTMLLDIAGQTYALVGTGAADSPRPAEWQLDMLRAATEAATPDGALAGTAGVGAAAAGAAVGQGLAGAAAGVAGVVASQVAFHRGLGSMREWQDTFAAAGLSFRRRAMNYMAIYVGVAVAALVLLLILKSTR